MDSYREIKNYPNYRISPDGKIFSKQRKRFLKPEKGPWGHGRVTFYKFDDRKSKSPRGGKRFLVHRLVAELFIPNPNGLSCVLHNDSNALNNSFKNLRWGTQLDNMGDRKKLGRYIAKRGEEHYRAKLNQFQVKRILLMLKLKTSRKKIASMFHVSIDTVGDILYKRSWAHIS